MAPTTNILSPLQEKTADHSKETTLEILANDDDLNNGIDDYTLSGAKLYIIVFGLGLAVFLMALDMSILTTAIPLITEKFHSTTDIGWYMSAYTLSLLVVNPH
jgi:hypothetical protein